MYLAAKIVRLVEKCENSRDTPKKVILNCDDDAQNVMLGLRFVHAKFDAIEILNES